MKTSSDQIAYCRFGSERFDVYSDTAICTLFKREFQDNDSSRSPDVIFRISRQGKTAFEESKKGPGECARSSVSYSNRYCDFDISFSSPIEVNVRLRRSKKMAMADRLPVIVQRLLTRKFNSVDEQEYGYLVYKAVLWILFLHNINAERLFLHASGFARGNRSVLLCGTGGVGKTSLSAKILAKKDTLFVSDDIVTVSPDGVAYANGMYVHAYPYNNLEGALPFQHARGFIALLNRCHWNIRKRLLGSKGACRRISPFELHQCDAADATGNELAGVVWLSRDGTNDSGLQEADASKFVEAHDEVLRDEVQSAFDFYATATRNGWNPLDDGMPGNLDQAVLERLRDLASQVSIWQFNVADNRSAAENADALLDELEEKLG